MLRNLRDLYGCRELFIVWTTREVRVRYKQSVLGAAWAILQPLTLAAIFSVIFSYFMRVPTDGVPYPIFSYCALLPWTFFSTSISFAVPSLTQNINLVTKVYFPREVLPAASVAAAFIDFLVASIVFGGMMLFYGVALSPSLLVLPLLLAIQIALTLGVVLLASAINVFYRDIRFIVPLLLQLWMYATPVIYPASIVPDQFRGLYMLNPMAGLIEAYRTTILNGMLPDWSQLSIAMAVSVIALLVGYRYFKRVEGKFADLI